jgi:exonuclease VII small subunit
LALFELGQTLAAFCNQRLENAVLRVEQLTAGGELAEIVVTE